MAHEEFVAAKCGDLVVLDIDKIDSNPMQPPTRIEKGIKDLTADIRRTKFIMPIVVSRWRKVSRFTAIDGHRRIAALKSLGAKQVDAIVITSAESVQTLFLILNRSAKYVNAANLFWAWAQEDPDKREAFLGLISKQTAKNIKAMVEYFGTAEAATLADDHRSPHIAKFIKDAQNIMVNNSLEPPAIRTIGRWVIKHGQTNAVNRLRRDPNLDKTKARKLHDAIVADRPLTPRKVPARQRKKVAA